MTDAERIRRYRCVALELGERARVARRLCARVMTIMAGDRDKLRTELEAAQAGSAWRMEMVGKLEAELAAERVRLAAASEVTTRLQARNMERAAKIAELEESVERIDRTAQTYANAWGDTQNVAATFEHERNTALEHIAGLETLLADTAERADAKVAKLERELDAMDAKNAWQMQITGMIEAERDKAREDIAHAAAEIQTRALNNERLKDQRDEARAKVNELESLVALMNRTRKQ